MFEDLAVPVVRIRSGRAAELPGMIRLIGDCLDCRETAEPADVETERFLAKPPRRRRTRPRGCSSNSTGR